jgi:hypothetical protein
MKEAVFILPLSTNYGRPLINLHRQLKADLCKGFGGYTSEPVTGGWVSDDGTLYEDNSLRYTVAVLPGEDEDNLITIISLYGRKAEQGCLYYRGTGDNVEFITLREVSTDDLGTFAREIAA